MSENEHPDESQRSGSSQEFPSPSLEDLMSGRAIPPEMLSDLHTISELESNLVVAVVDSLANFDGIGSHATLESVIADALGAEVDNDIVKSVRRTINSLQPSMIPDVMESLEKWIEAKEDERRRFFSRQSIDQLRTNLDVLISKNQYGKLIRKAERLLRDVGNEFRGVKFVCDLRPVFDDPRKNVDAFVVLANMRIHYLTQSGDRNAFELALTEDELKRLSDEIKKALSKVDVLKSMKRNLVVPKDGKESS